MADVAYQYLKLRKEFGKQPLFSEIPSVMIDSIDPNPKLMKEYILRNPVHKEAQTIGRKCEHYINTKRVKLKNTSINHAEGGWPKEVHYEDEEATARYRRRWERDDGYVHCVLSLSPGMYYFVDQNNAIEMYQSYFDELEPLPRPEQNEIHNAGVFREPEMRPVSSIAWTPEHHSQLLVAYCATDYQRRASIMVPQNCLLWDITKQSHPVATVTPECACFRLATSPHDPHIAVGGLANGKVCEMDLRVGGSDGITYCPEHESHRDPVSALTYIYSRTNTEFMTGSTDGQCFWWDTRNLSAPTDRMTMTLRVRPGEPINLFNADGVTSLSYDRNMPTRFLAGFESGFAVNVNRKGRTLGEQLTTIWEAYTGPVRALVRNAQMPKMFLTVGDYSVHIFCDDIRSCNIIHGTAARHAPTDAAWLPQRMSTYVTSDTAGCIFYWDMVRRFNAPIVQMPITDAAITKLRVHEEGKLVGVGDVLGRVVLASLSENMLHAGPNDRALLTAIYDREAKREHILEARLKEIRLKQRQEAEAGTQTAHQYYDSDAKDDRTIIAEAELDYKRTVEAALRQYF